MRLGDDVSIWYGAVLRGDLEPITIGARTNIQDGTVIHVADDGPCEIGADTVVGHRAMIHACRIEDACLIGMQSTILDGAVIGAGSVVGAGAVVTQRTVIPPRSLVLGAPAKVVRPLDAENEAFHRALAAQVRPPQRELPPRRAPGRLSLAAPRSRDMILDMIRLLLCMLALGAVVGFMSCSSSGPGNGDASMDASAGGLGGGGRGGGGAGGTGAMTGNGGPSGGRGGNSTGGRGGAAGA